MKHTLIALLLLNVNSLAQKPFEFFPGGTYDERIPTPKAVLGYDIGERFTEFRNLERYLDRLAATCDRVKRVAYGETVERRPLQLLILSSPRNISRLEEIRQANLKLTDPRNFRSIDEAQSLITISPAIVWLSYGVHGNESSSPEAAMQTAYQLCAGTDSRTLAILEDAVVIIDPNVNPDGRERYVQWINSTLGTRPNVNPDAAEHSEPWPGGRTNHYYFDLNRDWSWLTQQETRARVRAYREWMPHVHVDYHEMGYASTYFFFPAAPPYHVEFPDEVKKWGKIYGEGNAQAFDQLGIRYYTGESFDLFYPGYGDSWPSFNGAIGMTYEQAGHSRGGLAVKKPGGEILTLRDRAHHHFLTGIATLETTVKHRKERVQDFFAYWQSGLKNGSRVSAYLIKEDLDPNRAAKLAATLLQQGIEIHQLQQEATLDAQQFYSKKSKRETFPKGTYFVSMRQPNSRLVKALLEPESMVKDTFFYDVSAWSLPVAFGLSAYTTEAPVPSSARRLNEIGALAGSVIGGKAEYAYVIPWEQNDAARLTWRLLEKDFKIFVASRSFETVGKSFTPGTIIVPVGGNDESLHHEMMRLTKQYGVDAYAARSGLTMKGINLGSNRVHPIKRPEIAIVMDSPVSPNDYGELWHLFDKELEIPFTAIRIQELSATTLSKYNVIILPDGGDYRTVLDSVKSDKLKRWMQDGGILIGIEGGAHFLGKSKSGITGATLKSEKKEDDMSKEEKEKEKEKKEGAKHQTLFEKEEQQRLERIPGSIFAVVIDTTHPIGYGMKRITHALKANAEPIELSEAGHNVARFAADSMQVSGYATRDKAIKISDSAYIIDFKLGKGHAVLFSESVTFRSFWKGLEKLLINSILFLPQPE